jgi:signal transduction histidine kinase/CheY-like chemotaxis protein
MPDTRLLIVEDESIVAKDIQRRLKNLGYTVAGIATAGDTAIQQAEALKPDLVLMDIMLKGNMDGVDTAQQIRARLGIPVVYLTAHSDEGTLQRAKLTGPFGYVLKPFEERDLHTTIEIALYQHATEKEIKTLNQELEHRVAERTAQLKAANQELQAEITVRRLAEETERQQRTLAEALRDTAAALTGTLDFEQVLDLVLAHIERVVPHDAAQVMLVEDGIASVVRVRGYTERGINTQVMTVRLKVQDIPLLRSMVETGQPLAIPVTQTHPLWVEVPSARWVQSYASAPIRVKGKVIGFVNLNSATAGFFSLLHAERLQAFADQAGVAIENARLYSSLQDALKTREEMIQNVSHELRTPLTMLYGYIGLLESGDLGALTDEQKQAIQVMRRQGDRLRFMVDRLITYQSFDARVLQRIKLDLSVWLQDAIEPWKTRASLAGITLELDAPQSVETAFDPTYLNHVIVNLLDNAIKFSPNGGIVQVRARAENAAAVIAVTDQGVGIAPGQLKRIFEVFYQADGSSTRRFGGMGIGLALCRTILEAHGGRIWAASAGENKGSTFYAALPLACA